MFYRKYMNIHSYTEIFVFYEKTTKNIIIGQFWANLNVGLL